MTRYYKSFFLFILLYSLVILLAVLAIEYILKIPPCALCLYQRLPYIGLAIAGTFGFLLPRLNKMLSYLILLLFFTSVCLAFFNVGIEEQWFNYHSACISNTSLKVDSFEEFKKELMEKDIVSCDLSQYNILGLSLAAWNLVISMIMLLFSFTLIFTLFKRKQL